MRLARPALVAAVIVASAAVVHGDQPPLTIVAPAAPGGGWDQTARAMQRALLSVGAGDIV